MLLTPAQANIAKDTHRFRIVNCGRRFGKTSLAVEEMKGKLVARESKVAYIAPTYQQARDVCWEMLKKELHGIALQINESRLEIRTRNLAKTESICVLRGWESIETLRGQAFDFLVLDEVAMYRNFWVGWQEVLVPTLTDRRGEVLFISTPKGYNFFYDLFNLQETNKDYKSFQFTTYDNPHIPVEEIESLRKSMTDDRFAQEYLASFRKVHGLVYKEFNRDLHVTTEEPHITIERILGVDFGYTNPTAMLLIVKDNDNNYWIREEYYKTGKTNAEIIEAVKTYKPHVVYPDPAEPDRIEEMKRVGLNIREVSKDIPAGINKVRELFKANRIKIHPSCVNLISELESYVYPDKKPERNEPEVPVKEFDHALDCLRYSLYMNDTTETVRVAKQYKPSFAKR